MKLRKRKNKIYDSDNDSTFDLDKLDDLDTLDTLDDLDDLDDISVLNRNNEVKQKINKIKEKIKEHDIDYDDIIKLDLSEDDQIWFVEYIQILRNTPKYTEERYRIKNLIYNRYKNLEKKKENHDILNRLREYGQIQVDILTRICETKHPDYIKNILYKKYLLMNDLDKTEEYFKLYDWIDTVLDIPTTLKLNKDIINNTTTVNNELIHLRDQLNNDIYGLDNVKERIIEAYCAVLTNPSYKKKIIALVGPPGTGKTALGKSIANAFGQTFSQISFGGIKDPNILTGFSMTYIGSRPGEFVNKLRKAKVLNTVILLDEIDKIPDSVEGHSISSVLLHALDKTQNEHFQDMYMPEIPINLSHVFFILAMNDETLIDPILKDRLYLIKIDGYTLDEKVLIGRDYILPRIMSELRFNKDEIIIDDTVMKYIIQHNSNGMEKGVRNLERDITTICEKINVLKNISINKSNKRIKLSYRIDGLTFPVTITKYIVNTLLD